MSSSPVSRATLYATAVGVYQAAVNGTDVDDQVMKPGWTPYPVPHDPRDDRRHRPRSRRAQRHRRATRRRLGHRALRLPRERPPDLRRPAALRGAAAHRVRGRALGVGDDGCRLAGVDGPIAESGLYDGEHYDARRALVDADGRGIADAGFDDAGWSAAAASRTRSSCPKPASRRSSAGWRSCPSSRSSRLPSGKTILDFGQNLVGRLRLRGARRRPGTEITLRHAEVLEDGELGTRPLRSAAATDRYILARRRRRRPGSRAFTFHGFRYAEIDGLAGRARPGRRRRPSCVAHRHGAHRLVRVAPTRCSTGCTRTSSGACAATSSTSRPTARSATSGSAGPATSRSSRRPPRFLYDVRGFLDSWLRRPRRRAAARRRHRAVRRARTSLPAPARARPRPGATPPSSCRGCCTSATATRRCSRDAVPEHARRGSTCSLELAGDRRPVGRRVPVRRLARPGRAAGPARPRRKTDADLVATAYFARSADARRPRPRRCSGDEPRTRRATRRSPSEVRAAFRREYVTPTGRMVSRRADRVRAGARVRARCPTRQRAARRRPAGRARARRRLPDRHRLRRHAADLRRAHAQPGTSTRRVRLLLQTRMPVVALPGDDGRDDDLGALGQHAARTARSTRAR